MVKFREHLVLKILSGEKTVTWRLFDDKDLQEGDRIELVNWNTGETFGAMSAWITVRSVSKIRRCL